jgi:hypothetical protein
MIFLKFLISGLFLLFLGIGYLLQLRSREISNSFINTSMSIVLFVLAGFFIIIALIDYYINIIKIRGYEERERLPLI